MLKSHFVLLKIEITTNYVLNLIEFSPYLTQIAPPIDEYLAMTKCHTMYLVFLIKVTRKFSSDTAYLLFYKKIDLGSSEERVRLNSTIVPQIVDPPLRIDLLNAVDKDNERFVRVRAIIFILS